MLLDRLRGVDEVNSIVDVLLHSSADRQHVGIEDDILRGETHLVHQDIVRALANADLLVRGGSLAVLVESHHNNGSSVLSQQSGLLLEELHANLERNRVHNGLSLAPLQSCHDNIKLGCVKHKRNLGNVWLSHSDLHKLLHGRQTV